MIGIGPILNFIEAMRAAPKSAQLFQSGKFSVTMLMSNAENPGRPAHSVSNIRIMAAAPMRPGTAGLSHDITPSKKALFLNFI